MRVAGAVDPLFESAWLKWMQGMLHAETLEADVQARSNDRDADPVRAFRTEYHPKRHGFAIIVEDVAPIPVRWRLLLGDIANNYRAALDHLAWALVSRGRTPPGSGRLTSKQERGIYFPICQDRHEFNAEIEVPGNPKSRPKLAGVRRADAAKARRCQPYHRGAGARTRHPLVLLSGINTRDKHRAIQPLWAFPTTVGMEITYARDCLVREHRGRRSAQPLEAGAEIAFARARKTGPHPKLEVQLRIATRPVLENGVAIRDWAAICGISTANLLWEFSAQPASIHEVGAKLARWNP